VSTGFGPVSSAVGMFEPVTITGSTSASPGAGAGGAPAGAGNWANVTEESSKPIVSIPHPVYQMNGRLMTGSFC
jgi:hypothetical protein